jgi:protein-S-isoprenylcysteine O-methyltransferase Ste14
MSNSANLISPSRFRLGLRVVTDVVVVVLFSLLIANSLTRFIVTRDPSLLGAIAVNAIITILFVSRREAGNLASRPSIWLLSITGTVAPLLMRPNGVAPSLLAGGGAFLQAVGLLFIVAALLSLRRSFGIVPANRGVQTGGLYRFVRHPLYGAEILCFIGFVCVHPSGWNIGLFAVELAVQWMRAAREEELLSNDPAYKTYLTQVRFRLLPGVI